jgi:glutaminyl-tRNA synthetase
MGTRQVPFSKVLYIEQEDFAEVPPPKYFRLSPGREVRLRYAYFVTCTSVVHDPASGEVSEIHCSYDPATRGGDARTAARSRPRCTGCRRPMRDRRGAAV